MTALAARQETVRLIDEVPDYEMPRLLLIVQAFAKPLSHSVTDSASESEEKRNRIHAALQEVQDSWSEHNDPRSVDQIVRDMRRGRQFDIR